MTLETWCGGRRCLQLEKKPSHSCTPLLSSLLMRILFSVSKDPDLKARFITSKSRRPQAVLCGLITELRRLYLCMAYFQQRCTSASMCGPMARVRSPRVSKLRDYTWMMKIAVRLVICRFDLSISARERERSGGGHGFAVLFIRLYWAKQKRGLWSSFWSPPSPCSSPTGRDFYL